MKLSKTPTLEERLKAVVRVMVEDYRGLGELDIFKVRDEFFRSFYEPAGFGEGLDYPIVFVDSGHTGKAYSTDSFSFTLMNLGAVVRRGSNLEYITNSSGAPEVESYAVYSSITPLGFRVLIEPLDERQLLVESERAGEVSDMLSSLITQGLDSAFGISLGAWERKIRYFNRMANYIISLMELSYCVKALERIPGSICVLDGTLVRWYGAGGMPRRIGFDGLDIVSLLTGVNKDRIINEFLGRVYGLAKSTKFTTIARSRRLLEGRGGYGSISVGSVRRASDVLEGVYAKDPGVAEKLLHTVVAPVYGRHGVYALRTPLSVDGVNIYVFSLYTRSPLIKLREGFAVDEASVDEASKRLAMSVGAIFSKLTKAPGYPPHGFMDVDQLVRLRKEYVRKKFEPRMISFIREVSGRANHPLLEVFKYEATKRLGYVRGFA
jgi:hypothetical protein